MARTADEDVLTAAYELRYDFRRTCGPIIGRFLAALKAGRLEGVRTASGKVIVPAVEYDPETGMPVGDFVPLAGTGTVKTWAWVSQPRELHPLQKPFAWALIQLDGADTAMLHAVDAGEMARMKTGARVKARFADERVGHIRDLACFDLVDE
jgi:uncharacterized OB-fold protein